MKKYKYYLFDFDETLFDTSLALKMIFKESYKKMGIEIDEERDPIIFSREPLPVGFKRMGGKDEDFETFYEYIKYYLNSDESINLTVPFPDTILTIFKLVSMDVPFGIVTSNAGKHVRRILEENNIDSSCFTVICGNEKYNVPKPDPMGITTALKETCYQDDLKDVVYVGDSINDCIAGERAGIDVVLLDRFNEYNDVTYPKINSLMELFD